MARGDRSQKAMQQRIAAGMDLVTRIGGEPVPTKAELRASIPAYDESKVQKIPPNAKSKKPSPKR